MRTILSALNKKILWNSVHYEQSYRRSCWPTLSRQCTFSVCQCIWVRATWLWCRGNFTPPPFLLLPNFPQSDLGRRADSRWALPQISSLYCIIVFCYISVAFRYCFWHIALIMALKYYCRTTVGACEAEQPPYCVSRVDWQNMSVVIDISRKLKTAFHAMHFFGLLL